MAINRKQVTKVILICILALLITLFLFFMVFKVQIITGHYFHIHFDHVGSLTVGAVVRMAGVRIGTVSSIEINKNDYQTVIVTSSLYPGAQVRRGSRFIVMSGSLIGDQYIEVLPGKSESFISDGEIFRGEPIKNLDSFLLTSDTLIKDFTTTMSVLSEILRDNQDNINKTLLNIREASDSVKNYLSGKDGEDSSILKKAYVVLENMEKSTSALTKLIDGLSSQDSAITLLNQRQTQEDLRETLGNLKKISESLVSITADLKTIMDSIVGPAPSASPSKNGK